MNVLRSAKIIRNWILIILIINWIGKLKEIISIKRWGRKKKIGWIEEIRRRSIKVINNCKIKWSQTEIRRIIIKRPTNKRIIIKRIRVTIKGERIIIIKGSIIIKIILERNF